MSANKKTNNDFFIFCLGFCFFITPALAQSDALPKGLVAKIPAGYDVLAAETGDLNKDGFVDYVVVARRLDEIEILKKDKDGNAPKRPVFIYIGSFDGEYHLAARNDSIVYAVNEGGQCDPFLDSGNGITISGTFFTIENGVDCGQHWTDYITFKYDSSMKNWIFHKRVFQNWVLNNSKKTNADALKLQTSKVTSGKDKPPVLFDKYKK